MEELRHGGGAGRQIPHRAMGRMVRAARDAGTSGAPEGCAAAARLLHCDPRVPEALDIANWQGDLLGGRVVYDDERWMDMATGASVTVRAWLIGARDAQVWEVRHGDALFAWVLSRGLGWVGLRVDVASGTLVAATHPRRVEVPAELTGAAPRCMTWLEAARAACRAGIVPVAPAATGVLRRRPAAWWGRVAVPVWREHLEADARDALGAFVRSGGTVVWLRPARGVRMARRGREGEPMREVELLDLVQAMDRATDDREALRVLCEDLRERCGAAQVGVARADGQVVLAAGSGSAPAQAWLASAAQAPHLAGLASEHGRFLAVSSLDSGVLVGTVWAFWPHGRAPAAEATSAMSVAARLAAPRLLASASVAVPPAGGGRTPRLIGDGALMVAVRSQLERAARSPFPVLLLGESGCGKELAARTVHEAGPRRVRRFVAVNCAALPDDLVEAELFGHVRGAYTGAMSDRAGVFEEADGGTLLLDEVGDLSLRAQAKLLRVLQEGEVRRLGENVPRRVDVRLIAATNVALEQAVAAGQFRADLFYRLAVVCVRLPPLRERRDDIPTLIAHLWADCAARVGTQAQLHPALVAELAADDWPGNVRELQNVLAALAVDAPRRGLVRSRVQRPPRPAPAARAAEPRVELDDARRQFEVSFVQEALSRAGGRRTEAARRLGLSRQGLSKLVRRLGLEVPQGARPG